MAQATFPLPNTPPSCFGHSSRVSVAVDSLPIRCDLKSLQSAFNKLFGEMAFRGCFMEVLDSWRHIHRCKLSHVLNESSYISLVYHIHASKHLPFAFVALDHTIQVNLVTDHESVENPIAPLSITRSTTFL